MFTAEEYGDDLHEMPCEFTARSHSQALAAAERHIERYFAGVTIVAVAWDTPHTARAINHLAA